MLLLLPSLSPSPSQSLLIALSRRSLGLCRALLGALMPWPDQQQHHPQVVAVKAAQLTSPRRRRSHFGAFMALRLSSLSVCTCACVCVRVLVSCFLLWLWLCYYFSAVVVGVAAAAAATALRLIFFALRLLLLRQRLFVTVTIYQL